VPARPVPEPQRGPRFSVWSVVAPVALLVCVSLVVVIARGAGWVGGDDDGPAAGKAGSTTRARPRTRTGTRATTTAASTTTTPGADSGTRTIWRVQPGDTFAAIADRFGTTVEELSRLNPDADPQALQVGQRIRVR
jgi:hypothetical protein